MHVNELGEGNQKGHSSVQLSVQILPLSILEICMLALQIDLRLKSGPGKENSTSRIYLQPWPGGQPVFHHVVNGIRTGILTTRVIF